VSIRELQPAVEKLRAEDLLSMPIEQLADELVAFEDAITWLETERVRRVAAFENRNGIDLEGHSSTTAFLKHRCRMTGGRAQRVVTMANRLSDLPFVAKALSVGDISLDQARVFINLPDHLSEDLARDEVSLVNAVDPLSVADTRRVVEYWRSAVDGPGCDATAEELAERRYMHASRTWEGMVKVVDGLLDAINGDLFLTALGAATPPRSKDDTWDAGQRRADALSDIARFFLDSGAAPGNEKPQCVGVDRFGRFTGPRWRCSRNLRWARLLP
jgi:hypothetical protein